MERAKEQTWSNMSTACVISMLSLVDTPVCGIWQTNAYQGVTIEIIPAKRMFSFLDARQDTQCTPYKWNMFYHWTLLTWAGTGIIWDNMWLSHWLCLVCLKIEFSLFALQKLLLVRLLKVSNKFHILGRFESSKGNRGQVSFWTKTVNHKYQDTLPFTAEAAAYCSHEESKAKTSF